MNYRILCEVSGGVTGYRAAYLKDQGVEQVFDALEQAEAVAGNLNATKNSNPYRTADFRYTVEPFQPEGKS